MYFLVLIGHALHAFEGAATDVTWILFFFGDNDALYICMYEYVVAFRRVLLLSFSVLSCKGAGVP